MSPLKAAFFFIYCLFGVAAVGTAFSHLWTTHRLLSEEKSITQIHKSGSPILENNETTLPSNNSEPLNP